MSPEHLTFRVSGIPRHIQTKEQVTYLLSRMLNITVNQITIYSLATSLAKAESDRWKVATVMFPQLPQKLQENPPSASRTEWRLPGRGPTESSIRIDTHFLGLTPLKDMEPGLYYNLVTVPGLSNHPFQAWQKEGDDPSYNWVRDSIAQSLPNVRPILYGYDSRLFLSSSRQTIPDLGRTFIDTFYANDWGNPDGQERDIILVSHSLGGIIVEEAVASLYEQFLEESESSHSAWDLLYLFNGALFFGVPSLGMDQSSFLTLAGEGPNKQLVEDISPNSKYLLSLQKRFRDASKQVGGKKYWAYETSMSPTLQVKDGQVSRDGKESYLVSEASATWGADNQNELVFPIAETHTNMVKFPEYSPIYPIIVSKLQSLVKFF